MRLQGVYTELITPFIDGRLDEPSDPPGHLPQRGRICAVQAAPPLGALSWSD